MDLRQACYGVALSALIGCDYDAAPANEAKKLLENARTITVLEERVSVGKNYDVLVDDKVVATVSGKNFNLWTDRFDLRTIDGSLLAYEKESARFGILWRAATFYDPKENVTGYLGEEIDSRVLGLVSPYYIFHVY